MKWVVRFKKKWNIKSDFQLIIIFIVFAITGSLSLYVSRPILSFFSINSDNFGVIGYYPLRIAIVFPIYQILIIVVGTMFGQFNFFWKLEKKILSRLRLNCFFKNN